MNEGRGRTIMAMKGLRFSGKTTWARRLSEHLEWPVIDQHDIQASIVDNLVDQPSRMTETDIQHLDDVAFRALYQITTSILQQELDVIIDSPLSSRSRVDGLLQLCSSMGAQLIVVECLPKDKFVWRSWIERCGGNDEPQYPFKPSSWDSLLDFVESFALLLRIDLSDVSKLVVDTTADFRGKDLFSAMDELLPVTSGDARQIDLVQWLSNKTTQPREKRSTQPNRCTHFLSPSDGCSEPVNCEKCDQPVSGPRYSCRKCSLSLHLSCAESPRNAVILSQDSKPHFGQDIPEKHKCKTCIEEDEEWSRYCSRCVFRSHLKCDVLPIVLRHDGDGHPLCLIIPAGNVLSFMCHACGDRGNNMYYSCMDCNFKCHVKCALAPSTIKNKYHRHDLVLTYPLEQDDDDWEEYYCHACETRRNPIRWFYHCRKCDFACHFNCKTFSE